MVRVDPRLDRVVGKAIKVGPFAHSPTRMITCGAGDVWTANLGGVIALARDPERRDRLYAATSTGDLYESGNRGQAWRQVNNAPIEAVVALFVLRI